MSNTTALVNKSNNILGELDTTIENMEKALENAQHNFVDTVLEKLSEGQNPETYLPIELIGDPLDIIHQLSFNQVARSVKNDVIESLPIYIDYGWTTVASRVYGKYRRLTPLFEKINQTKFPFNISGCGFAEKITLPFNSNTYWLRRTITFDIQVNSLISVESISNAKWEKVGKSHIFKNNYNTFFNLPNSLSEYNYEVSNIKLEYELVEVSTYHTFNISQEKFEDIIQLLNLSNSIINKQLKLESLKNTIIKLNAVNNTPQEPDESDERKPRTTEGYIDYSEDGD